MCQKKSVLYETECRHVAVQRGKQDPEPFIALKHIQATLIRFQMGSQSSFSFFARVYDAKTAECLQSPGFSGL